MYFLMTNILTNNTNTFLLGTSCSDCACLTSFGSAIGVQTLTVNSQPLEVQCYSGTHSWTVIQRRVDGSVAFNRDWVAYKNGFGSLSSEFWLGNDNIHQLTNSGLTYLRIDLMDNAGVWKYAEYSTFTVDNEANQYRLNISGYSGDAGDSMAYHDGMLFSTYDRDNDLWTNNCALNRLGGWWYKNCHEANLNGEYGNTDYSNGINWNAWHGFYYSMTEVRMMIRKP
ncbi:ficolin-2-like [Ostrea edulis]|uniref:ficolin-2-like n=1 Tax=Ostrea edulis TaxID=37623 RepID=UPI0024AE936B|nr:ficolin-2-like [Ostrea edulis]